MGINSKFDRDFHAIDLTGMADDMLAKIVADHAADRFRPANRANTLVAGAVVPYSVAVNGRIVHRGRGDVFPQNQVALAVHNPARPGVRKLPTVIVDWAWDGLKGTALQRAVENYLRLERAFGRLQDAASFARTVLDGQADGDALFRFLFLQYAKYRYPELFRLSRRIDQARRLFRVFRLVRAGAGLIGGEKDRLDDPEVLAWIASELRDRSPIISGTYHDAHELYADGKPLMNAADVTEDAVLPDAEEFSFTNTVPYARKIEFGRTQDGRDFVVQVPNRIYERVAEAAQQRFGKIADIRYEMRGIVDAVQTPQRRARRPHNRPDVRFPSIVVRF